MKTLRSIALAATSALVLAACASVTPYQPASKPGGFDGYSQTMIENDRARVTFGGNSLTDRETVENYLLYRTAQIAVERGFSHFTLQERDTEEKTRLSASPGYRSGFYDPYFGYSFFRPRYGWSRFHSYSRFRGFNRYRRGFGASAFYDPFYDPFFNDFDVREITKYRASAEAKFSRGAGLNDTRTFNAQEVIANLGPTIQLPEDE
jgi:hypothetical protein